MKMLHIVHKFQAHHEGVSSVAFSPDGKALASGGYDCALRVWNVETWQQIQSFKGYRRGHVSFAPDGGALVSGGIHWDASVYDTQSWRIRHVLANTSIVWGIAFTPDGDQLAILQPEMPVRLWDTKTWKLNTEIDTGQQYPYALAFAPVSYGSAVALCSENGVRVLDNRFHRECAVFPAHWPCAFGVTFMPDGKSLATGGADNMLRLWSTGDWHMEAEASQPAPLLCVTCSPDSRWIVTGNLDGAITIYSVETRF